jgi:hypothetical protein
MSDITRESIRAWRDAALLAASPGLTSWAVTNALLQFHLSGADDAALGGDLAYWYGTARTAASRASACRPRSR